MKKQILLTIFISVLTVTANADQFCDGFNRGYVVGYMQTSGSSLEPLTPLCPLQPLKGFNDPESDYEHGYILGFQKGIYKGYR